MQPLDNSMRTLITSILLSLFLSQASQATTLRGQWELQGFSQPESIVTAPNHPWIYVSNINGQNKGFISRVSKSGQIDQYKWIDGLAAPTGMGILNNHLYVVDSTQVHEINLDSGKIIRSLVAHGAVMLNDLTIGHQGQIFVSDIAAGKIYTLVENQLSVWLKDKNLPHPNGLLVQGNHLYVANMASKLAQSFKKDEFGSVFKVDIATKSIQIIPSSYKLGGLDGLTSANDALLVSHFPAGEIYRITEKERTLLATVGTSSADIYMDESSQTLFVPFLFSDSIKSFKMVEEN